MSQQLRKHQNILHALVLVAMLSAIVLSARADTASHTLSAASDEDFARPHDIVLSADGTLLYVADNGNHRIVVLDAQTLETLGTFGESEVREPHDVVFTLDGDLLVADTGNSRIAVYAVDGASGKLIDSFGDRLSRPEGVAVLANGRVIASGAGSGNVVAYDKGEVVGELGGFSSPHDVEISPTGDIWLADSGNDRMVKLSSKLEIEVVLEGAPYAFNGPRYMDFDNLGRMYVADKYANQIKIIDESGVVNEVLGTLDAGKGEGLFDRPEGVEIRGGTVWFSDTYNNRIVRYDITPP